MAFETQFEQMLSGTHAATVTASTMIWTSPKGTITFKR
jgi:heat shock protein HslJ